MKTFDKDDLARIRMRYNFTSDEMGEAIGYGDPGRTIRALISGERKGSAAVISGTAAKSLTYLLALHKLTAAHREYQVDMNPTTEAALSDALDEAIMTLPKRLQK